MKLIEESHPLRFRTFTGYPLQDLRLTIWEDAIGELCEAGCIQEDTVEKVRGVC